MKKFENPSMNVLKLEMEDILTGSDCGVEYHACVRCYDTAAVCTGIYSCDQLYCPRLAYIDP